MLQDISNLPELLKFNAMKAYHIFICTLCSCLRYDLNTVSKLSACVTETNYWSETFRSLMLKPRFKLDCLRSLINENCLCSPLKCAMNIFPGFRHAQSDIVKYELISTCCISCGMVIDKKDGPHVLLLNLPVQDKLS